MIDGERVWYVRLSNEKNWIYDANIAYDVYAVQRKWIALELIDVYCNSPVFYVLLPALMGHKRLARYVRVVYKFSRVWRLNVKKELKLGLAPHSQLVRVEWQKQKQ